MAYKKGPLGGKGGELFLPCPGATLRRRRARSRRLLHCQCSWKAANVLSKDELVQALTEDKTLLEGLVENVKDLFPKRCRAGVPAQADHRGKGEPEPHPNFIGFKGNLFTRFRAAFLDTFYEYVVQDEERASTLRDQKSKAEAYASFEEAFEVQSYVSCAENALNEVFEELDKDIAGGFLVPRFGALDRATHDQGTKVLTPLHPKAPSPPVTRNVPEALGSQVTSWFFHVERRRNQ